MSKGLKIGLIVIAIIIVGFLVVKLKQYYDNTYVGTDYYLQVPSDQDMTVDIWESNGYTIKGKKYKFTAYNESGDEKIVEFAVTDDGKTEIKEGDLLQPNTYIKVNASKNRVISWKVIKEQDVPKDVLK